MLAQGMCDFFYDVDSVVSADEIRWKRGMGGKNPLLVYQRCFDKSIEIPSSSGRASMNQKKDQPKNAKKKRKLSRLKKAIENEKRANRNA